ncbi:molybdate ABC transporter substrate-binding protein [Roseobacter ponti]|uniref:Molybdate ABC transporter substrate-binding protein n=1 Tax=Roseobacter ponti TaxID=1891787 RepID=A0A858SWE5_9RHOB|nr:molybdate ABC transporter substrate-binding protein [Roseobacter ponti]QJF51791.1 molybdate ABC transporter substrate-binding protein [Roseobacter ponti]
MRFYLPRVLLFAALLILTCAAGRGPVRADAITVFAAASMKNALEEIAGDFMAATSHSVTFSFAGSSVLARQIALGAPADIFVSASTDWMDYLEAEGRLEPDSRSDLAGNSLVLIAGDGNTGSVRPGPDTDLPALLSGGRLAMALTDAVPAGIYGKAALQHYGMWESVAPHVAQTDNVRAALALVAQGAAPLGIVYASDAAAEPRVRVIATFAPESHPAIVYPVAAVAGRDTPASRALLDYLGRDAAHIILMRHGFAAVAE